MRRTGVGRHYREPSWLEHAVERLRRLALPRGVRTPLKRVYEAMLAHMPGDHLVCRLPGGEAVRVDAAYRHLAWNGEEYAALKACARPGAIVLDVGANIGAYTLLFAQWVGSDGHVYAFEPARASRSGLERHLTLNEVTPRVTVRAEAIAAAPGSQPFIESGTDGGNRLAGERTAGSIEVATTSIDAFCESAGLMPDVIKIDIEGAELDALRGARRTIARRGSALALFVELHPSVWPALGVSREALEQEFARQQLVVEALPGVTDPWTLEGVCVRLRHQT
jgi:FkbM family methyltransferase